ncbi:MAG: hypothetical protein GX280_05750 [Lentisphaerae bacterium]|nr:hypothetical protein [Lentisphaerota bacterium]
MHINLEKSGYRFLLLFFSGSYLVLVMTTLFRDALAGSESTALGFGLVLMFLLLWAYLGSMILPQWWYHKNEIQAVSASILIMILPTVAMTSFIVEQVILSPLFLETFKIPLLPLLLMTLPVGLWTGAGISVLNCDFFAFRRNLNSAGLATGIFIGGIILSLAVERIIMLQMLLVIGGAILIIWTVLDSMVAIKQKKYRNLIFVTAFLLLILNITVFCFNHFIDRAGLTGYLPGWRHLRSVETAEGRINFFKKSRNYGNGNTEFQITLNRQKLWGIPDDSGFGAGELLPITLQVNRPYQRLMLVTLPFHNGVEILENLPHVTSLEVVYPFKSLFEFGRENDLFMPFYRKSAFVNMSPFQYLEQFERKFEAIIVLDNFSVKEFERADFVGLAKRHLHPDGVFAAPMQTYGRFIENNFPYVLRSPGRDGILIGANQPLTANLGTLGNRYEQYSEIIMDSAPLPNGVFEILYSQLGRRDDFNKEEVSEKWINGVMPSLANDISYWMMLVALMVCVIYWSIRFWFGRYGNTGLAFAAMENGFCCAGFFYCALVILYWNGVAIYQMTGLLLGLSGIGLFAMAFQTSRSLRVMLALISCLLPLLLFFDSAPYCIWVVVATVALMNISCGQTSFELEQRLTLMSSATLIKWQLAGGFYGMTVVLIMLLNGANMVVCGVVLMLLRLTAPAMAFTARKMEK